MIGAGPRPLRNRAADYPSCVLLLDRQSVPQHGVNYLNDRANGTQFVNPGNEWVGFTRGELGFQPRQGTAPNTNEYVSNNKPLVTWPTNKHLLMVQCAVVRGPGTSEPFLQLGDADTPGVGAYLSPRVDGAFPEGSLLSLSPTRWVQCGSWATTMPTVDATFANIMTFDRSAASDTAAIKQYRLVDGGIVEDGTGTPTEGTASDTMRNVAFDWSPEHIRLNIADEYYVTAVFHFDNTTMLSTANVNAALQWMVKHPGYLWPGWKGV